jgi:CopG family transcriptional regulator, nickel-responsive regulator
MADCADHRKSRPTRRAVTQLPGWDIIMSNVSRFSVSVESELLDAFSEYCQEEHFATRSEAVRQMIHDTITKRSCEQGDREVAGSLTLIFDHHRSQLHDQLVRLQHDHTDMIVSTMHTHLTHDLCMEVVVMRGQADKLQQIASRLKGLKGILRGELVMAAIEPKHVR